MGGQGENGVSAVLRAGNWTDSIFRAIPSWPAHGRDFVGDFNGDGAADIALLRLDGHWFIVNGRDGSPQGA